MFCIKCGKEVPDNTKFCPNCGENLSLERRVTDAAGNVFHTSEQELKSSIDEIHRSFNGGGQTPPYAGVRLRDDRGLLSFILLTIITCGIYGFYFIYKMAADVNIACEGDGEETSGIVAYILLSIITCNIYQFVWSYKLGNRLASNANRYELSFQENGTSVLLWMSFGSLLCGIGPLIAFNILIKNTNQICNAYNRAHNL